MVIAKKLRPGRSPIQIPIFRQQYGGINIMVRRGDLNYSITLITRNLFIFIFALGLKAQMPHIPASIVRLLYGERTPEEKAAEVFSLLILPTTV
jgi:hypothetical protein